MSEADAHTQDTFKLTSATFLHIIVSSKNEPFSDLVVAYICAAWLRLSVSETQRCFLQVLLTYEQLHFANDSSKCPSMELIEVQLLDPTNVPYVLPRFFPSELGNCILVYTVFSSR